ncbi:ABC transporter substrate-binding protein [Chthonobacter albigriseus]|uniref:ABC transporter substrate-binding protein n=1 Tax=Chthonobacter albigriseus TaxID=1683161 RepID=UPI0015EE8C8E|nr:ABC transporter substrate-binding protein [Chthonobacter albigriseus]
MTAVSPPIRRPLLRWASAALAAVFVAAACGPAAAQTKKPAKEPLLTARFAYLGKAYEDPPPLSLLDPIVDDEGLSGAQLGLKENQATGMLLRHAYEMEEVVVPADADVLPEARRLLASGQRFIIADLDAADLLAVADLAEARDAMILNIRDSDDRLRQADCRANVFHVVPSFAQRADALGQYLAWKRWYRWFVIAGETPADRAYVAAIERAATRFGAEIVEIRAYTFEAGSRRIESGHQQIQTQMPQVTQGAPEHDVVFVADAAEAFGEYLLYRTERPRPVVGTHGLVGVAWHRAFEQFGGLSLQSSFERHFKRWMRERDYNAWLAAKMFGDAVTRGNSADPQQAIAYIRAPAFKAPGHKGIGMSFRTWDHQLRQPILVAGPRALVSMSPQEGFLHESSELDTLGVDAPETLCKFKN